MQFFHVLRHVSLFKGITQDQLEQLLPCLGAETRVVRRGDILLLAGSKPAHIGIVLEGHVSVVQDSAEGDRTLLNALSPGGVFAEALCAAQVKASPVSVVAASEARVLLLAYGKFLHPCSNACAYHTVLAENLLRVIAQKNLFLQKRLEIVAQKTIRAKVLLFLQTLAQAGEHTVTVPFGRQEMAEYLCAERSALSHELMRMRKDGVLIYRKNTFTML